ncbi:fungal-specific transcription factor domain-containing protein [Aspergillus floccosus]
MDSKLPLLPWGSRKQLAGSLFIRVSIPIHHTGMKLISSKGEQTGPTSALDFCSPGTALPRHLLIPSRARKSLPEEDRNFLLAKGVFTLPGNNACASLLRAYMSHVHPIMPIIEIDQILNHYHDGRLNEYNILLLWSVFFAGVNASRQFIPASVYEEEGYSSRKEMKSVLYSRAKCMYYNGRERDKVTLLQSSLLLGFWHSGLDEHMQPWYWTGIAISLCQVLGLHRNPDESRYNSTVTEQQRMLWRRLWWSCFFRDRWLGLTYGRPMRINLKDCDTPMPLASDVLYDVAAVPGFIYDAFLPNEMPRLAQYWVTVVELSKLLGECLTMSYQIMRPTPSLDEVEALETKLLQCKLPDQYEKGLTRLATFYCYHVHLHYQALAITFYRPFSSETAGMLPPNYPEDWCLRMRLKADAAASQTNSILETLAQNQLLDFAGPMTPPLLVPAMQTHLLFCRSADSLSRNLRLNKINMLMLILEELQKRYTVASLYRGIFLKAMQQVFPNYQPCTSSGHAAGPDQGRTTRSSAILNAEPVTEDPHEEDPHELGFVFNDGFVDALMDEASLFNLWEHWSSV